MPSAKQIWGAEREALAEARLLSAGYAIVARNWRGGGGELDRIAWLEELLVFVEVRARSTSVFGSPAETVDHRKQVKLIRAASAYLSRFPPGGAPMTRFDVVAVVHREGASPVIEIFPDAFPAPR